MVCSVPSFPKGLRVKIRQWVPRPHPKKEHMRGFWKDISFFDLRSRASWPQASWRVLGERLVQEASGAAFASCLHSDGRGEQGWRVGRAHQSLRGFTEAEPRNGLKGDQSGLRNWRHWNDLGWEGVDEASRSEGRWGPRVSPC